MQGNLGLQILSTAAAAWHRLIAEDLHWGVGLNYVQCGPQGEPSVVHVEMEGPEPEEFLREIAPDFMTFLRMLEFEED